MTVGPRLGELLDGLLEPLAEDRLAPQEAIDVATGGGLCVLGGGGGIWGPGAMGQGVLDRVALGGSWVAVWWLDGFFECGRGWGWLHLLLTRG